MPEETWKGRGCAGGNLSFCERKVSPGPPSKESRFYAARPAEGGAGGVRTDGCRGLSEQANQEHVCGGWVLSAKERFPPGPLPKKAAYAPSAPHRARRAARGRTEKRVSEQANQEHVRGCAFFLRKKGFPRTPFQRKPLMRRPPRIGQGGRRGDGRRNEYQSRRIRSMYAAVRSFCERKVSPGPPSKESRLCAVRPA